QAYEGMLRLLEQQQFEAPHLVALQKRLEVRGAAPSTHMARLTRYEGFAQLRTQGPFYLVLNVLTLWDLFCLERIEHFARSVGPLCERWFQTVGEFELLCSLAALHHADPATSFPELVEPAEGLFAQGLVHPLLPAK